MKSVLRSVTPWVVTGLFSASLLMGCGTQTGNQSDTTNQQSSNQSSTDQQSTDQSSAGTQPSTGHKSWSKPPAMSIDTKKTYDAVINTSLGSFTIELFAKDAPITVNNFVFLANQHYYDNILFHRVIKDFMIQTGDPKGDGTGGPGYSFQDELSRKYQYGPGIVAMANSGPNTNGSQFFICTGEQSKILNQQPNYTIFGKVISGMDVVEKIASVPIGESTPDGAISKPKDPVYMKSVQIETK
jgi:cyclophilin family peptidyl-prolyl cis-trans isomerase